MSGLKSGVMSKPEAQGQKVTIVTFTLLRAKQWQCWRVGTVLCQELYEILQLGVLCLTGLFGFRLVGNRTGIYFR